jgi:hypothetical protein
VRKKIGFRGMGMKPTSLFLAATVCTALLGVAPAVAGVVYDNGGPNQANAYYADSSFAFTQSADDFTLSAGADTITGVNWWGICVSGSQGLCPSFPLVSFTLYFYSDNGGAPGNLIAQYAVVGDASQTLTGKSVSTNAGTKSEYSYSANISALPLIAGTTYWLGISNATGGRDWAWETTDPIGGGNEYSYSEGTWFPGSDDLAFNLTGPDVSPVPEPITLSLFGAGLVGAAATRRRQKTTA